MMAQYNLDESAKQLVGAPRRWRLKLNAVKSPKERGAFINMRAIIHSATGKRDAFIHIISAGGGEVLDVQPPYRHSQEALQATVCFVDKSKIDDKDRQALQQAGVVIYKIDYMSKFLLQENLVSKNYEA